MEWANGFLAHALADVGKKFKKTLFSCYYLIYRQNPMKFCIKIAPHLTGVLLVILGHIEDPFTAITSIFDHFGSIFDHFGSNLSKESFKTRKWVVQFFSYVLYQSVMTFGTIKSLVQKILNVDPDGAPKVTDSRW